MAAGAAVLGGLRGTALQARAQEAGSGGRYYAATGHNLREPFLSRWRQHGGQEVFGLPISEEHFVEKVGIVQTFENLTLVYDPSLSAPWDLQCQQLPNDVRRSVAPSSARRTVDGCGSDGTCRFFPETGHTISGGFLSFWEANGDLAIFGLPVSESFRNPETGLSTQVFERAVLEGRGAGSMQVRPLARQLAEANGLMSNPAFLPAPPTGGATKLVKAPDGLRLRSGPSTDDEMVALLADNAEFIAVPGAEGNWIPGYADGYAGWVASKFLTTPPPLDKRSLDEWKVNVWQGAALGETNTRREPTTESEIVRVLEFNEPVEVAKWVKGEKVFTGADLWAQIGKNEYVYARNIGRNAPVAPPPVPSDAPSTGRWIDVNLTQQLMVAYDGRNAERTIVTTTGMAGWETPTGFYTILWRVANETMTSGAIGAEDFFRLEDVLFTQYFTELGHAVHYAWWRTPETIGRPGSHGCLNTLFDDARFLWDWANVGTPVLVHY